jgi:hypothetical protein
MVLWAWDRPEDLRFVDPRQVAVASLAGTVRLRAARVEVRARPHPLVVPTGTALIPVVRIETDPLLTPVLSSGQRAEAVDAIAALVGGPTARHAQLDFDATRRERSFYRALLTDLRARLPPEATLSITALLLGARRDQPPRPRLARILEPCVSPHATPGGDREARRGADRGDARVPEALHRLVDAAHVGCPVQDDGTVARAAFQLLHRRYPRSPWAAKTTYWYR